MSTGSLCSGYEGLGAAVHAVFGGDLAWVADNDEDAAKILAARFDGVPNLGDITAVDWRTVEPVDILCAGFPCQDVSAAGRRAGLRQGTRSGLWLSIVDAIAILRPRLLVIENVRGLLTARGDDPTPEHLAEEARRDTLKRLLGWLDNAENIAVAKGDARRVREVRARAHRVMGAHKRAVARCKWHERRLVRAIGTVLGSLAGLGYDATWTVVSASDVGAPHRRERVFVLAWDAADTAGFRAGFGEPDWGTHLTGGRSETRLGARRDAQPASDSGGRELQRRRAPGFPGIQARAQLGEGDQRERAGNPAGDCGTAVPDPEGDGRGQGRPEHEGQPRGARDPLGCPGAAEDTDRATGSERRVAGTGEAEGRGSRADAGGPGGARDDRKSLAAGVGKRLPVRQVEPDGPERATAERSGGDDAPADAAGAVGGRCGRYRLKRSPERPESGDGGLAPADAEGRRWERGREIGGEPGGKFEFGVGRSADAKLDGLEGCRAATGTHAGRPAKASIGCGPADSGPVLADPDSDGQSWCPERDRVPGRPEADDSCRRVDPLRRVLDWGPYELAVRRWERALGRPAPRPTEPGRTGERLSPRFVEWMMGLPEGWVTDVPGLSRNAQLKVLGNGVVPAQAEMALRLLLDRSGLLAEGGEAA